MRKWLLLIVAGVLFQSSQGQDRNSVTLDAITLKMPVELALQLQRRIDEGGQTADTAVEKVADLAKDKKLEELDRWHVVANGDVCKRMISGGKDINLGKGETLPIGTQIEIEPTTEGNGLAEARFSMEFTGTIKGDHSKYASRQIGSSMRVKMNEWFVLSTWRDEEQTMMFLAKFSKEDADQKAAQTSLARQSSMSYSLCLFDSSAVPRRISGDAARKILKTAKVLEAGIFMLPQGQQSYVNSYIQSLNPDSAEEPAEFSLNTFACISADQKTAETGMLVKYTPKRGGMERVNFGEWLELPVGEPALIPLNDGPRSSKSRLCLAVEIQSKVISPSAKASPEKILVSPSARRLLAEAAGLRIPKPEMNRIFFHALPEISESLAKLGLEIPPGVKVSMDLNDPAIWMYGPNAPRAKLQEILSKHLPPASGSAGFSESN